MRRISNDKRRKPLAILRGPGTVPTVAGPSGHHGQARPGPLRRLRLGDHNMGEPDMPKRITPRGLRLMSRRALPALTGVVLAATTLSAQAATGPSGTHTEATPYSYPILLKRLFASVKAHHMVVVAKASASRGAAARGVKIPGNAVIMVFRNDFAVTMLKDSVAAGIEAPIRIYVTANRNGTADITYRTPSAVFAPYHNRALNHLADTLDPIFAAIVRSAAGPHARPSRLS